MNAQNLKENWNWTGLFVHIFVKVKMHDVIYIKYIYNKFYTMNTKIKTSKLTHNCFFI